MKLNFSLKNKEANIEADVEGLVEKSMEYKSKRPEKKTRYQIKQEEKRKNKELDNKHFIQGIMIMVGIGAFCLILAIIASIFNI